MSTAATFEAIDVVLRECGATPGVLSPEERRALDEDGYCVFHNMVDPEWLTQLQSTFDAIHTREGAGAGLEVHQEKGTRRIADLVNKGACYDRVWMHPKILAATHHILRRDFKLLSLNGRDAVPGEGAQALHSDTTARKELSAPYTLTNALWMADDFTLENGATRIVPKSHRWIGVPSDVMADANQPHPQEIVLTAPAGSVVLINGSLRHGGTVNRSGARRRVYHCAYIGREMPQFQMNQRDYVRKATYDRITPAARYILDV